MVCSRAFTALTRAEGSDRDRVDAARIESAVELQVARNRFLLHAPFRLRRLLEQRDEWLQLLRAGVGLSRSYGLRRLKGHTDARKAARTFDPNSQVGAYVRLLDLNFKVETWGITPPQRIEAIRRLQSLLALTEKDLGPRYIAEVELILSCHQGGRTKLTPLWSEIAARARRARWILQHTPGDPLLIIACRQEVDMWAKANRLDLAEKVWEEAEAALQAFCEGPRRKELARIDLPVRARGMIAIERAVLFREYLKDRRRARAEGLQGLKQARAVYQECKDLGLHGADVERRRFELQAVHGIMGDLEALGRSEEAVALGSQYDERKSCALHRDFMRRMVEHHLERGALKKAKDRVGWLEHDYPKPEHRSDWRRLRARLEAAQAKQTDGPR